MINLRCAAIDGPAIVIIPPFGPRPNVAIACSISLASRRSITLSSIPEKDEAANWIAANCPMPDAMAGSRRTATRVICGQRLSITDRASEPPSDDPTRDGRSHSRIQQVDALASKEWCAGRGTFPPSTLWRRRPVRGVPDDAGPIAKFINHPGADLHLDPGRHRERTAGGKRLTLRRRSGADAPPLLITPATSIANASRRSARSAKRLVARLTSVITSRFSLAASRRLNSCKVGPPQRSSRSLPRTERPAFTDGRHSLGLARHHPLHDSMSGRNGASASLRKAARARAASARWAALGSALMAAALT
jgi:hypothetical protein